MRVRVRVRVRVRASRANRDFQNQYITRCHVISLTVEYSQFVHNNIIHNHMSLLHGLICGRISVVYSSSQFKFSNSFIYYFVTFAMQHVCR